MNSFQQMPADAKAWVYASNRHLTPEEQQQIRRSADAFFAGWTAHQVPVQASFDIIDNVLLVVMVNETDNQISGCGIDKSVAFMKKTEQELGITIFNRLQLELVTANGIVITDKSHAKALFEQGIINPETVTFNKMITTKQQFDDQLRIPVSRSWFYPSLKPAVPAG